MSEEYGEDTLNGSEDDVKDTAPEEDEGISNAKYQITSYGADYTVDSLVQRVKRGDIYIPDFQRSYVWSINQASKFIESLLLGLPVPGIFLSKDGERKLVVIDGQQRLRTLQRFYDGLFGDRKFDLRNVREDFAGLIYDNLKDDDRRQLDDSILHATIIQQIYPEDNDSSVYHIFERLNTGGTKLQPQEIRSCIYHGPFIDLLKELNSDTNWRDIYGKINKRGKDQELILRFLALRFAGDTYSKPLNEFLNTFMQKYRFLPDNSEHRFSHTFTETIGLVNIAIGNSAFRSQRVLNAAAFDSIMVGISKRLEKGPIQNLEGVKDGHDTLLQDPTFIEYYTGGTTDEKSVEGRIKLATKQFAEIS